MAEGVADLLNDQEIHQYLEVAGAFKSSIQVREDTKACDNSFSRIHPMASWFASMIVFFSSSMLINILLAQPIIDPWQDTQTLMLATLMWYITNYTPFDIGYKILKWTPVYLVLVLMGEINRAKAIIAGVDLATSLYPNSWFIILTIATLKGNGPGFIHLGQRLMRGMWTPAAIEMMYPSFNTKVSFWTGLFVLLSRQGYIELDEDILIVTSIVLLLSLRLISIKMDPFAPIEKIICGISYGIFDKISSAITAARAKANSVGCGRPRPRIRARSRSRSQSRRRYC